MTRIHPGRSKRAGRAILHGVVATTLIAAAIGAANAVSAPPDPKAQETLYGDATIIDGTGAPPRAHQDLLVRGDRIVATGPHGSLTASPSATHVDVAGRFIIPGLIDSHVHLATPPNNKEATAILRRDLYGGVTAVRDMADDLRPIAELGREALTGEIPAPDIYYAVLMAGPSFFTDPRTAATNAGVVPGTAPWMQSIAPDSDLRDAVARARGTGATAIKIYADLPPEQVKALAEEAHRQHLLVWAHATVFPTRPSEVIDAGTDVLSHVCYLGFERDTVVSARYADHEMVNEAAFNGTGDDPVIASLYQAMKVRGEILDPTGSIFVALSHQHDKDPSVHMGRCSAAFVTRLTTQAWHAGVPLSTGTDGILRFDHDWPEVHDELYFLAHDVGMPALQVLHSATLVGAQAAGQARNMGSIETGKLANFVILRADPSVDIRNIRSIETTVKRGHAYPRSDYRRATQAEIGDDDYPAIDDASWKVAR